jgi:hypothetical protein
MGSKFERCIFIKTIHRYELNTYEIESPDKADILFIDFNCMPVNAKRFQVVSIYIATGRYPVHFISELTYYT